MSFPNDFRIQYPKINSVFKRDEMGRILQEYSRPEFRTIDYWIGDEKVDGLNMRIGYLRREDGELDYYIGGRTDSDQIPNDLHEEMNEVALKAYYRVDEILNSEPGSTIHLYGEGYGPKIQNGFHYSDQPGFILFDVKFGTDRFGWMSPSEVRDIADTLNLTAVPQAGILKLGDWVDYVRQGVVSRVGKAQCQYHIAEGVVLRPADPLYDRRGERVIAKLKTVDFKMTGEGW